MGTQVTLGLRAEELMHTNEDIQRAEAVLKRMLGESYRYLKTEEKKQQIDWLLRKPRR